MTRRCIAVTPHNPASMTRCTRIPCWKRPAVLKSRRTSARWGCHEQTRCGTLRARSAAGRRSHFEEYFEERRAGGNGVTPSGIITLKTEMNGTGENRGNGGPQGSSSPHFQKPPLPPVRSNSSTPAADARAWNENSRKGAKPQRKRREGMG